MQVFKNVYTIRINLDDIETNLIYNLSLDKHMSLVILFENIEITLTNHSRTSIPPENYVSNNLGFYSNDMNYKLIFLCSFEW